MLGGDIDCREATDDVGVEVSQLVKWVMSRLLAGHVQRVVSQMKKTHEQVSPIPGHQLLVEGGLCDLISCPVLTERQLNHQSHRDQHGNKNFHFLPCRVSPLTKS